MTKALGSPLRPKTGPRRFVSSNKRSEAPGQRGSLQTVKTSERRRAEHRLAIAAA